MIDGWSAQYAIAAFCSRSYLTDLYLDLLLLAAAAAVAVLQ